jgi:hypothetical protein
VDLAQGEAGAAEPLARRGVEIHRRAYGERNWQTALAESLLGAVLTALGRYAEAEPLLMGAQRALNDIPGAQGQAARENRARLAALETAKHNTRLQSAERSCQDRVPIERMAKRDAILRLYLSCAETISPHNRPPNLLFGCLISLSAGSSYG